MTEQSASGDLPGAVTMGHSPSFPAYSKEAIRDARSLRMPDLGGVPSEDEPFYGCFAGVNDAGPIDSSSTFEEAQRLFSKVSFDFLTLQFPFSRLTLSDSSFSL